MVPSPKSLRYGIIAVGEHVIVHDKRVASDTSTIVVQATTRMAHMWSRSKDFILVEKGQILALMKIEPAR